MAATKPITITVLGSKIKVNPESWTENYGVDGRPEITADIKAYVLNLVREQLNDVGVLAEEV